MGGSWSPADVVYAGIKKDRPAFYKKPGSQTPGRAARAMSELHSGVYWAFLAGETAEARALAACAFRGVIFGIKNFLAAARAEEVPWTSAGYVASMAASGPTFHRLSTSRALDAVARETLRGAIEVAIEDVGSMLEYTDRDESGKPKDSTMSLMPVADAFHEVMFPALIVDDPGWRRRGLELVTRLRKAVGDCGSPEVVSGLGCDAFPFFDRVREGFESGDARGLSAALGDLWRVSNLNEYGFPTAPTLQLVVLAACFEERGGKNVDYCMPARFVAERGYNRISVA